MMRAASKAATSRTGLFSKFCRSRDGATAIEFAILALPFTMLCFAILETTVSFTAQQVISNATDKLARQVRTGQITLTNTTESQFRTKLCNEISIMVSSGCPGLEFDLESYTKFSDVPTSITMTAGGDIDSSGFTYDPGGKESINALRVFYKWPVMTDLMKASMAGLPDGKTLLYASATWQNEPF